VLTPNTAPTGLRGKDTIPKPHTLTCAVRSTDPLSELEDRLHETTASEILFSLPDMPRRRKMLARWPRPAYFTFCPCGPSRMSGSPTFEHFPEVSAVMLSTQSFVHWFFFFFLCFCLNKKKKKNPLRGSSFPLRRFERERVKPN